MIAWNGNAYTYDPFHLMWDYKTPSDEWIYLYTADDERAWSYKTDNTSLWTLRGPGSKVLREYTTNGTWSVAEDYIYRDGLLLAAETPQGTRHLHLDHLGTPRLVSDTLGQQKAYHVYYPYGEEATAFNQDTVREKFTGHERDLGNPAGAGDDLDYMHARFCSPLTGRFLGVDAIGGSLKLPQSWNRYVYSRDNPLIVIDPDGMEIKVIAYSPAFRASVDGALVNIEGKSPRLKIMVEGLRSSKNVHKIQETNTDQPGNRADSQENADNGKGTGSTTYTGLFGMDENGTVMTIDEILAHELSHAEDADTGTRDSKPACNGCASKKRLRRSRCKISCVPAIRGCILES